MTSARTSAHTSAPTSARVAVRNIPRIVIAGAASSVGKTTITAGLIAALRGRGLRVQPFKCGPDYIDPSYHERAAGRPCRNLDAWMLNDSQLLEGFARACRDADIAVVEGVMGLFDGSDWHDERASTAQIAKLLGAPVLLVVDIAGAARSAAAVVLGCQHFDPDLTLGAVVLNFAGSAGHATGCGEAITAVTGLPILGWLPRRAGLQIPERHLGLVPGAEHLNPDALIAQIAVEINARFDVVAIVELARTAAELPSLVEGIPGVAGASPDLVEASPSLVDVSPDLVQAAPALHRGTAPEPVIAVARDAAFCFYYPENLELLEEAGAAIEFFSPLRGERPSRRAAGVYLGGGYPELHGAELASNVGLWQALKELHARDAPIFAECGGFMVLTQGLVDREGRHWPMAGLIPGETRMTEKLAALGYRHATALRSNLLTDAGEALRGHEFRYSTWTCEAQPAEHAAAWRVRGTRVEALADSAGFASGNLLASYLHLHFGQHAGIASRFVDKLRSSAEAT
jgi:cobyrinic acid a,c-diamide synthase